MSKQTQSFPAFPAQEISLRDYFIAHAPAEPQPWFIPAMPWFMPAMSPARDREIFADECSDWLAEQAKQRYVQWPAAWADEMLKAREVAAPVGTIFEQINQQLLESLKDCVEHMEFSTAQGGAAWDAANAAIANDAGVQS